MSDTTLLEAIRLWEPPSAAELATQIPGVTVERLIARGGMAAVYLAHQQSLDRAVALKVLPPELGRIEGFNERFESEARVLAKLRHPGIVTVFDFGRTAAGSAYMVMELVSGEALAVWGRGKPLAEKLPVAMRLIEGVAYLHRQGVVHADLKPDNVLVDADGQVRLLDFGLATPFRTTGAVEAPRFGTPPYTAPEAYRADARPDPRSDLYSLGQTLCEFFAEQAPPVHPDPAELAAHLGSRELAAAIGPMIRLHGPERPASLDEVLNLFRQVKGQPRSVRALRPRASSTPVAPAKTGGNAWKFAVSLVVVIAGVIALRHWHSANPAAAPTAGATPAVAPLAADPAGFLDPPEVTPGEAEAIFREASATPLPSPPANGEPAVPAEPPRTAGTDTPPDPPVPPPPEEQPGAPPSDPKIRDLNDKFVAALARERDAAGDPRTAALIQGELDRMGFEHSVPETDPPEFPESIQRLRAIYRAAKAKLAPRESVAASPIAASSTAPAPAPPAAIHAPFDDPRRPTTPAADPAKPKALITLYWRCADQADLLLNGKPTEGESARGNEFGARISKADVEIAEGDVVGFKLLSRGYERDFEALAKVGSRLLFVTDTKWQTIEGEPSADWWTGVDKRGAEPRKLNSREYNNRLVQDFCGFTEVPRGNVLACWGGNPARSNIRRIITKFDVQTALGVGAR